MSESAPKRRLPFKPTALRKTKSATAPQVAEPGEDSGNDDLALFQRSREMVPMMAAEAERRVRREKEREEARTRRGGTATWSEEPGSAQKRRASEDWDDAGGPTTPSRQPSTPTSSSSKRRHGSSASPTKLTTPIKAPYSPTPMPPSWQDDSITILDGDDDDDATPTLQADISYRDTLPRWVTESLSRGTTNPSTPALGIPSIEIVKDDDSDDEVEEVLAPSEEETDPDLQVFINAARQRLAKSQDAEPSSAETFKVQVESTIPGTATVDGKPVAFKLSASGALGDLKTAWCAVLRIQHVELSHADVFFTWRGRRLYNTTTLGGLGVATMGSELLYAGDAGDRRGLSADRKKVVLRAWTEALYEEHVRGEERDRLIRLGELDDDDPGGADAAAGTAATAVPQEPRVRVTMRARQGEPVKVSVAAGSTVGDLVARFRQKRNLPAEAKVSIIFDGERLEEGTTLGDADIGDEEQVEVHLS